MVAVSLHEHRHHGHEAERLGKILELELSIQRPINMVPALRRSTHSRNARRLPSERAMNDE